MSNIIIPNVPKSTEKMEYDYEQIKAYIKEIINYGYVEKVDTTVPLKHDKVIQLVDLE